MKGEFLSRKKEILSSNNTNSVDTLITVKINNHNVSFHIHKKDIKLINEIQNSMKYWNDHSDTIFINHFDFTGDGKIEDCITSIKKSGQFSNIKNLIKSSNNIIWQDSLILDDDISHILDDSIYFKFEPFANYYLAVKYYSTFYINNSETVSGFYKYTKPYIYCSSVYGNDTTYWKNYFVNYKGKLIHNLSIEDCNTYAWYEPEEKFIIINSP